MKRHQILTVACSLAVLLETTLSASPGTAFTYQGRLSDGTNDVSGSFDLKFSLHDAAVNGNPVGGPITNTSVLIVEGSFTATLDFGSVFGGQARWLQIGVRTNGATAFADLSPRQELRPAPYAMYAANAASATTVVAGAVGAVGLQSGSVDSSKITDATIVATDLAPALLDGTFWKLGGNAGAGGSFLGTTDNQPLELRVNNQRALRIQPTAGTPSLVGGSNYIGSAEGSVIAGGAANSISGNPDYTSRHNAIGGGYDNRVLFDLDPTDGSTIAGGLHNTIYSFAGLGTIGGGLRNSIQHGAGYSTIAGGQDNNVGVFSFFAAVGGGDTNVIGSGTMRSTIAGGGGNFIGHLTEGAFIGGGSGNRVEASSSLITGGEGNSIDATNTYSLIAGGQGNSISGTLPFWYGSYGNNSIGGGGANHISASLGSAIGGGVANTIYSHADRGVSYSTISGGFSNQIMGSYSESISSATIGGGRENVIYPDSSSSFIGGGFANFISSYSGGAVVAGGSANGIGTFSAGSFIGGGFDNHVNSGWSCSVIVGGAENRVVAPHATIGGGKDNFVGDQAQYGTVPGGLHARARNYGQMAYASGSFTNGGDAQTSVYACRNSTTNSANTDLYLDGSSQRMSIPTSSTWTFDALVTGRTSSGDSAGYQLRGVIKNVGGVTSLVGSVTQTVLGEDAASWNATVVADDANDALVVRVSGQNGTTVRWVATVRTVEVTY